ncbi:serine/arginine repetitive matrix protein 2-like [Aphis craccivora]|uniref:Serine/arginine repetitive matrix protein 2-like n=1 Tax=Aphis craccivora TaxID=307492 RepID=A0A6G0XAS3_APHCR|nr:serine/arginine repetitive matrix protein 2-like [Aphis craccivora]
MDGGNTADVNSRADDSGNVARIPLLLEFDEPETAMDPLIADNDLPEAELEIGTQQQAQEMLVTMPSADLPVANVVAVRLGSGADDDLSTAAEAVEDMENMDRRGSRRRRGRRHRSRRSHGRRSRSRSRSRRGRSRRGRSRSDWSESEGSEMTVVLEVDDDDDVSTERAADGSRGRRKASRGRVGGRGRKAGGRRGVAKGAATRGARKSSKRDRRGRKTAGGEPARRTLWTDRLRSRKTRRQQKAGRSK